MRILFVDNHPQFTATVIEAFLHDHDVVVVPTVAAARELFATTVFDVAFVDYDLDDGKGDELVRSIRSTGLKTKLVAVSAHEPGNAALVAAGADAVCAKASFGQIQLVLRQVGGDS